MVCTFFNDSWEQCKLIDLGRIETGNTPSTLVKEYYSEEGMLWVTPTDINSNILFNTERKLSEKGIKVARVIPANSTLCTCIASIGKNAFLPVKCAFNQQINALTPYDNNDPYFIFTNSYHWSQTMKRGAGGLTFQIVNKTEFSNIETSVPNKEEQILISKLFFKIDNLITLHQRECIINGGEMKQVNKNTLLVDYYEQWINVYKEGAIRNVTMKKYRLTLLWLKKIAPKLKLCKLDRIEYQNILNTYALEHERQTTMDFHHQLKGAILDAVDEGYIERDPTRKVIIKGKTPRAKKIKYLNQYELHTLLKNLDLSHGVNFDWLILIIAKTGMRFSEAIALTPKDFDFSHQTLSINKTWDYKESGTFQPTKNKSSVRKIQIDWMVVSQFSTLIKDLPENEPIFVKKTIYNSTINDILERHCKKNKIPIITVHGLRHTHASLLLFAGVSIASVAQRLGHASMTTTQKTYLHIIQELENKDVDLVMRSLSGLC